MSFLDEVHRLREELRERERERDDLRKEQSPGAERRMEQWKREVGRELSSLRGHITRATSLGNLEERWSCNTHVEFKKRLLVDIFIVRKMGMKEKTFDLFSFPFPVSARSFAEKSWNTCGKRWTY